MDYRNNLKKAIATRSSLKNTFNDTRFEKSRETFVSLLRKTKSNTVNIKNVSNNKMFKRPVKPLLL